MDAGDDFDWDEHQSPLNHREITTPNWDTKSRCSCGAEFATKRGLRLHLSAPGGEG